MNFLKNTISILLFTCILSAHCHTQEFKKELTERVYYSKYWNKVGERKAFAYRVPVTQNGELYYVKYYYSNHNLMYEGNVKPRMVDGRPSLEPYHAVKEGKFTYYYPSGLIFAKAEYENDIPIRERIEYYDTTSRIMSVIKYDEQNASVTNYHSDGKTIQSEGELLRIVSNGRTFYRPHGVWTYYYRHSQTVFAIANYDEGLLNGVATFYDSATSAKIIVGSFMLGHKVGKWRYYYPDSTKRLGIVDYEHGLPYGDFYLFYPSGHIKVAGKYINNVRNGLWTEMYDKANTVKWQGYYKDDKAHIIYFDSANNDVEILEGDVIHDRRVGEWIWYDKTGKRIKCKENYNNNLLHGNTVYYTQDGKVLSVQRYSNGLKHGEWVYYYEGTRKESAVLTYFNDSLLEINTYYVSGKAKRKSRIENRTSTGETCFDANGAVIECEPFLVSAAFDGDVMTYIGDNLRYPEEAKLAKLQGKVKVGFVIDEYGKVQDPFIVEGFDSRCDEEALRLVSQMPLWIPEKIEGIPMRSRKILPIVFWLPSDGEENAGVSKEK